jgi:hypothetical protein
MPGPARWRKVTAIATAADFAAKSLTTLLGQIADEADMYCQTRSPSWQDSEKAECFGDRQDAIQEALDALGRADW